MIFNFPVLYYNIKRFFLRRDHPHILAGYGSLALEILETTPFLDAIVIPVGSGGLAAAVATVIKHQKPNVLVYVSYFNRYLLITQNDHNFNYFAFSFFFHLDVKIEIIYGIPILYVVYDISSKKIFPHRGCNPSQCLHSSTHWKVKRWPLYQRQTTWQML